MCGVRIHGIIHDYGKRDHGLQKLNNSGNDRLPASSVSLQRQVTAENFTAGMFYQEAHGTYQNALPRIG